MLRLATKFAPERIAFSTAVEAGYRFAELWLDERYLADWRRVVDVAMDFPLQYALHFPNHGSPDDRTLDNAVALYRALDCSTMVIHQPMCRRYRERLSTRDRTLRLAVENHDLNLRDFRRWMVENEFLTLDVEHLWKYTLDDASLPDFLDELRLTIRKMAAKLVHVHLPGYLPGYDEHRPMYCAREMVFPVLSVLAAEQFEGFVVSEVNTEFQNVAELRMDTLLFERWCQLGHQGLNQEAHRGQGAA
jgi:sugar phosphate isomerase/epimerase